MSTTLIAKESVESAASDDRFLPARLLGLFTRPSAREGLVVLFDQSGYSVTTFLTGMLAARACTRAEYGTFVLGLTLVFSSGVIQRGLVTIPFTVLSQSQDKRQRSVYLGSSFLQHVALSLLITLCLIAAWVVGRVHGQNNSIVNLLLPIAAAAAAVHFRVFIRSVLLAELRPWASFGMGIAANATTLIALIALYLSGSLTAATAYIVMAVGSALPAAVVLLVGCGGIRISAPQIQSDFIKNWNYGRWILAATAANLAGLRCLPWLTLFWCGREVVAAVGVITMVACVVRPAIEAGVTYLTPKLSNYVQSNGYLSARRKAMMLVKFASIGGALYVLFMVFFGDRLVALLCTSKYQGHGIALTILAAAICIKAIDVPIRSFLMAMKTPKTLYYGSICASVVTLAAAVLLIPRLGVAGVALAIVIHRLVSAGVNCLGVIRLSKQLRAKG